MNDDQLRQRLGNMSVPRTSDSARARAKHRALIAFQSADRTAPDRIKSASAWKWMGATVVACAAVLFTILHQPPADAENLTDDRQLLRQMEILFPGQVDSVVEQNGKVDLSVSQSSLVGGEQPVVVVFRKNAQSIRVLSFSGHHVCVQLGKEHRCFDVLATSTGSVILESNDGVWVTSQPVVVAGYSVQAQTMEASL